MLKHTFDETHEQIERVWDRHRAKRNKTYKKDNRNAIFIKASALKYSPHITFECAAPSNAKQIARLYLDQLTLRLTIRRTASDVQHSIRIWLACWPPVSLYPSYYHRLLCQPVCRCATCTRIYPCFGTCFECNICLRALACSHVSGQCGGATLQHTLLHSGLHVVFMYNLCATVVVIWYVKIDSKSFG